MWSFFGLLVFYARSAHRSSTVACGLCQGPSLMVRLYPAHSAEALIGQCKVAYGAAGSDRAQYASQHFSTLGRDGSGALGSGASSTINCIQPHPV